MRSLSSQKRNGLNFYNAQSVFAYHNASPGPFSLKNNMAGNNFNNAMGQFLLVVFSDNRMALT